LAQTSNSDELNDTLALAIISASQVPLVLLDDDFKVLATSTSFSQVYGLRSSGTVGKSIFTLGNGEWDLPRLRSLMTAVGSGEADVDAYELDFSHPINGLRRLALNLHRLDFSTGAKTRLMLTVVDLTDVRAEAVLRDNLIREKDILLQEVQHRVANSLQIIASVLLQNARKVQTEESRTHLRDAHQRLMSVAAVQRQLSATRLSDVMLKPYFVQLCRSLGASMIEDPAQTRIEVTGDGSSTSAAISVSLGLIVTELVINALKHAFPGNRPGVISVEYHSGFEGWTLSVRDDGVGMPSGAAKAKAGLGTAIVEALANQLSATITVTDLKPGTGVALVHADAPGTVVSLASKAHPAV
jgi:two-component sensor histidine kinase